jgi:uncharacterized protein YecE (DUF72 family)
MIWHIGCSGFHYKEWKEVFYPEGMPQRLWFEHYCKHFHALELNVSFYRFPQLKSLQNWYEKSPPSFLFSVKAPRLITHYKQFHDCKRMLSDFYTTCQNGLQEKLGAVLFQFPPMMAYKPETLSRIIDSLEPSFRNVLEFRHVTWWNEEVYDVLRKANISFCGQSHPQLPEKVVATNSLGYYRFHGVPRLYYSSYKRETIKKIHAALMNQKEVKEAQVFFNNTAGTAAVKNALFLQKLTGNVDVHRGSFS